MKFTDEEHLIDLTFVAFIITMMFVAVLNAFMLG